MALFGAPDVGFVLLGGRSLAGYLTEIADGQEIVLKETHGLGDTADQWAVVGTNGQVMSNVKLTAIYNSTDLITAVDVATTQELMYNLQGNTINEDFVGIDGVKGTVVRNGQKEEFHTVEIDFKAENAMDKGVVLAHLTARDDTFVATTTVDNSASSANGAVGYLGVSALTLGGYTNIIVKIRDSTDDISYADHITFAAVTAAPASERLTSTGTVNRYAHVTITWTGAGSGETCTFAVGMRRNHF